MTKILWNLFGKKNHPFTTCIYFQEGYQRTAEFSGPSQLVLFIIDFHQCFLHGFSRECVFRFLDANRMKLISWVERNAGWLCHYHGASNSGKQVEEQGRLCPRLNRKSSVRCYVNECRFSQETVLRSRSSWRCRTSDRAKTYICFTFQAL